MKKKQLIIFLVLLSSLFKAQSDFYVELKKVMKQKYADKNIENRIIAVNFWSSEDINSKEINKNFEKTQTIYEFAKLKGGPKGFVTILVCKDQLSSTAKIILNKDAILKSIPLQLSDFNQSLITGIQNIIFDENGNSLYENILLTKIDEFINSLITR